MRTPTLLVSALLALVALSGCGTSELHEVRILTPNGVTSSVAVFLRGQDVPRSFEVVALLQGTGHGTEAKVELVIEKLKNRAKSLGCDLLTDVHFKEGMDFVDVHSYCARWQTGM